MEQNLVLCGPGKMAAEHST